MEPTASKNARNKRKAIMRQKSNENHVITGHNMIPVESLSHIRNTRLGNSNRIPLTPLSNGNLRFANTVGRTNLSSNITNNTVPSPISSGLTDENRIPLSPFTPEGNVAVRNSLQSSNSSAKDASGNIHKRQRSFHKQNLSPLSSIVNTINYNAAKSRGDIFSSKAASTKQPQITYISGSSAESSALSEVLNPQNSSYYGKYITKSANVLHSIGATRLNFDQQFEDQHSNASGSSSGFAPQDDTIADFQTELYSNAETQACVNFGQPSIQCQYCMADVWFEERSEKARKVKDVEFSICCQKGKVQLKFLDKPPQLLISLMNGLDDRGNHFKQNIRAYNSMFSFTSIGGKIESSINDGGGPPQFILSGQNYHRIGSLLPESGSNPKFAQLYIYDTENELQNRTRNFGSNKDSQSFDNSLVQDLTIMIDEFNKLAKEFRRVRDYVMQGEQSSFSLRLFRNRSTDSRMHNIPTSNEVAALIVGDFSSMDVGRDIIVKDFSGQLTRLHETHTAFIPLQYPLLFPYGENGYQEDIKYRDSEDDSQVRKRLRVSMREFIAFRIQERDVEFGNIVNARRLFQQFLVDCYTMIEAQRLSFIRHNKKKIRCDVLNGLQEAVNRGETEPSSVGKRIILLSSFTGGMRYMFNNCQDAMAICKRFGYPDLFITVTCNTNWSEIRDFVSERGLTAADRPDIVCRVFKMKLDEMMTDFKKKEILGKVNAGMYTIEFQKRGLPHAHILLWLDGDNRLRNGTDIDKVISAELPHPDLYPKLANVVSSYMMHGPCGVANLKSPCMKGRKCDKYYPKKFQSTTTIDEGGYPCYKRRDSGMSVHKNGIKLDNRSVVPYSPLLLMRYQGHVNTEYCNKSNSIKYLFKYVNKGPDRANMKITNDSGNSEKSAVVDEIKQYYDCRYLSPCEAAWRIYSFDIHERWPPVQRLYFHLPNEQSILFKDEDTIDQVIANNEDVQTMFLAWFEANKTYNEGKNLTFAEFPTKFVYFSQQKRWQPRKQGFTIGRLTYVPAGTGELYYMRLLLTIQRGCIDHESIRTVNGKTYDTFQEACYALGLLADDKEYIDAIKEASEMSSGNQLRKLFVTLLVTSTMKKPDVVWDSTWKLLADGILYHRRKTLHIPGLQIEDNELKNLCLIELEKLLMSNGRSLKDYGSLPFPDFSDVFDFQNKFIVDELNYDRVELAELHASLLQLLTEEQLSVYDKIMRSVLSEAGGFFFLYGYGGTGKTFLWKTLSAALRSQGIIVLNVASSGIASLLLPGGKTAHSTFCIPLDINEESTCNIKQGSLRAKLLIEAKLIIWDEAPMMNRFCFEAFDRTMRDLMRVQCADNNDKPFGGKVVVLGGDFRQILPVVRKGSRHDIVKATINSSEIWKSCKVLRLTKNMRLSTATTDQSANEIKYFADWILKIGDGDMDADENGEGEIDIPDDLLISHCESPLLSLVEFVYPDILQNMTSSNFFEERAILAPTLECVEQVNDSILSLFPGDEKDYFSSDTPCQSDEDYELQSDWFTS